MVSAPTVSSLLTGVPEAELILDGLPEKLQKRVLRPAVTAAAQVGKKALAAEARGRSVRRTYLTADGRRRVIPRRDRDAHLYETATFRIRQYEGRIFAAVGFSHPEGAHGWLVEHGHRMVVGGSVARLNGPQKGKAPIEQKSKKYLWRLYISNKSYYRKGEKALRNYLDNWAARFGGADAALRAVQAHARRAMHTGEMSDFLKGAINTGGMYRKTLGGGGAGRVVGQVPGHPIARPAFDTSQQAMESAFYGSIVSRAEAEMSK